MPQLIVIFGPPLSGKSTLARTLARAFDDRTAVVSTDGILQDAIAVHDRDAFAELEMVHTQARLLVANFLKNRYNVVLEGAFSYEREGLLHQREQEIDQTIALMRNLAVAPLVVRLSATPDTLRERAESSPAPRDVEAALRIEAAYKPRYGSRSIHLQTDGLDSEELAREVLARLASA